MNKELKYGGYTASPNDHDNLEGDLAVAMNLIPENGTVRPVLPPSEVFTLPDGFTVMCIHHTSAYKHYILKDADGGLWWVDDADEYHAIHGDGSTPEGPMGDSGNADVVKVEPIGNTLVVLANDGVHYILWDIKTNRYKYLGQKPPRIDITFGLSSELVAYPGWRDTGKPAPPAWVSQSWTDGKAHMPFPEEYLSPRSGVGDSKTPLIFAPKDQVTSGSQLGNILVWGGGDFTYKDYNDETTANEVNNITEKIMAAVNKLIVEEGENKGKFIMPFFVRYACRLYDDTVMHSYPVLMIPNSRGPFFGLNGYSSSDATYPGIAIYAERYSGSVYIHSYTFRGRAYAFASKLYYEAVFPDLEDWKDIISSVDVYVSAPVFTVNQSEKVYGWNNMDDPGKWDSFYTIGRLADGTRVPGVSPTKFKKWTMEQVFPHDTRKSVNGRTEYLYEGYNHNYNPDQYPMPNYVLAVPEFSREELMQRLTDVANFYLVHSFNIDELSGDHSSTPLSGIIDFKQGELKTLLARDRMQDDYFTRDTLVAKTSFAYNGRINLAGVSRIQHKPLDAHIAWTKCFTGENKTYNIGVKVLNQERVNFLTSGPGQNDLRSPLFVFYPDPNAYEAIIESDRALHKLKLKPHPFLWGAYWIADIWDDSKWEDQEYTLGMMPEDDAQPVNNLNKVYTSPADNPFFFPSTSINTVGTGAILGLCAAVRPVSTGQMGYANLYIFTDNGVWTAKITEEGGYSDITLITGDVCLNPDSITQMETTVLFATARGIMLLSGSQAQCISETIDDNGSPARGLKAITDKLAPLLGLSVDVLPFRDFLGDEKKCARMIYDYRGQRVIVYNPACDYAYIYSLESNKWGMMASDILYSVKTYPDAMAVTRDGHLVNYSDPVEVLQGSALYGTQLLVTRPLTLDQPDVLKTIRTILQRGLIRKRQGHVQSVLYGSRDLMEPWHLVMSSGDENLRGFSGTPFKWFRVALLLRLAPDESVTSCSIQFEPRYINRLR